MITYQLNDDFFQSFHNSQLFFRMRTSLKDINSVKFAVSGMWESEKILFRHMHNYFLNVKLQFIDTPTNTPFSIKEQMIKK